MVNHPVYNTFVFFFLETFSCSEFATVYLQVDIEKNENKKILIIIFNQKATYTYCS